MPNKNIMSLTAFLGVLACGAPGLDKLTGKSEEKSVPTADKEFVQIPADLSENDSNEVSLDLTGSASAFSIALGGCASGYTATANQNSPNLQVYKFDQGCLAKLTSFSVNGFNYVPDVNFTTWQAGDSATFKDALAPANKINVVVVSTLASPVSGSEVIQYRYSEIKIGSDRNFAQSTVGAPHTLMVNGQAAPNFDVKALNYVGMTAEGAGQFTFTLECNTAQTGAGATALCGDATIVSDIVYKLVEDVYSGAPSASQLATIMASGTSSVLGAEVLSAGQGGTTNGGFGTKTGANVLTGPGPIHTKANMLLILQAAGASYLYFNVDVSTLTQL